MGLFDKSKNGQITKSKKEDKDVRIYIRHPRTKHQLVVYDIFIDNNTQENLTHAKIKDVEAGQISHISFKNLNNRTAAEMKKDDLFLGLARNGNLDELVNNENNYLGMIVYSEIQEKYKIIDPEEEKAIKSKNEEQKKKDFKETIKVETEKLEEYFSKKKENMKNPFLRVGTLKNKETGNLEKIYEGVDVTTGDFIILKNLNGTIVDGKYIYEGYLTYLDTIEEKDTRTKKELESYEVIFELKHEINSCINKGDVSSILQLLAKNEKLLKPHDFNYLGKIEKNGKIDRELNSSDMIFSYYKKKAENIRMRYEQEQEQQREIE